MTDAMTAPPPDGDGCRDSGVGFLGSGRLRMITTKVQKRVLAKAKRIYGLASWTPYQVGATMSTITALLNCKAIAVVKLPHGTIGTVFSPTTTLRYRLVE